MTAAMAAQPAPVLPTCVGDAYVSESRMTGNALELCFVENNVAGCWSYDLAGNRWSPQANRPYATVEQPKPVRVTGKSVTVCKEDMSGCLSVPLPFVPSPDDTVEAVTNADRSLVAITTANNVYVVDSSGRQRATIRPWRTAMAGANGVSFFRSASFVGDALAVYIADTPVTSAIRLYHPRSGKAIGNVNHGRPMSDNTSPVAGPGKNQYAFVEFDTSNIVIHDVTNGRLLKVYSPGKAVEPGGYAFLAISPDGRNIWGVSNLSVIRIDTASRKVARFEPPRCKRG